MRKKILIATILSVQLFAIDYSTFTNDELFDARGTVATEDRDLFKSEMKSRMQSLTPEERATYRGTGVNSGSGNGTMTRSQLKDGSGSGNMYKGSRGGGRR